MSQPVVTIERMTACAGLYVGRRVAELLGVPCLDQEILVGAARQLKQEEEQLSVRDERLLSFGQKLLAAFSAGSPDTEYLPPPFPLSEDDELFAAEKSVILDQVARGGAVVIGHGGGAILEGRPGVLRVFCHAPLEWRARRLMQLYGILSEREALRHVVTRDRSRERYLKVVTGRHWKDPEQYDLCIDTSTIGVDETVRFIAAQARKKQQSAD